MVTTEQLVYIIVMCVAGIVTVTGNGLLIYIMCKQRSLRNVSNFYMASLSIADTGVGLFVIAAIVVTIMEIPVPVGWCYFSPYFELSTLSAGIFSSLLISYDRHLAVSKALSYHPTKRSAVTSLVLVWVSAFVYSSRIFLQYEVAKLLSSGSVLAAVANDNTTSILTEDDDDKKNGFCNVLAEEDYNDLIFRCIDFVFLFIIPITCMVYWYRGIVKTLWAVNVTTTAIIAKKRRVVKLLIINVVVFFACWIPFYLADIINDSIAVLMSNHDDDFEEDASSEVARLCLIFFAVSHSYLNPIIFLYFHSEFRVILLSLLCKCVSKRRMRVEQQTEYRLNTIS
ncbi:tachykinin-like peptides receptor 99D [Ylistrum balloti]|uniref:tachykinin-like peptides receptor 99D n=1 Tax=Ylistrum balloti TaxID=509963 RepID=UPI0029059D89|nr:tachykinin-like peptides receptor 99D [Ylistrum balloti]